MTPRVAIVGTGTWGSTLALLLSRKGTPVALWARTTPEADELCSTRENKTFLPGVKFPDSVTITSSLDEALAGCRLLLLVVPAQTMRQNAMMVAGALREDAIVVSAAKGLEIGSGKRMSEVLRDVLPEELKGSVAVLSGPNLAREIAEGKPATTVVASQDPAVSGAVREMLMSPTFRVYTNPDVVGVELGGSLKNIYALGAGMADGLSVGDNAKAAFLTRGLAEMARLGVAVGANPLTFAGLAGLGDLLATCASKHSRNRYVGEQLARGRSLDEIRASMKMVAEGVTTTVAACELARRLGVEMPIAELTHKVLLGERSLREAMVDLMTREPTHELHGIDAVKTGFSSTSTGQ
ncbi:MAG: NAD(P)-dependent glycerol-3-phosphate dehydrogenase [Chloroflexi bacterium]|nr:NAD(P)-dependent glycerol-3-phosphate dehydrogenase [Chloroflexota bacterium]